jgi:hypothetical protein
MTLVDDNGIACFVDDLGVDCWIDDLGNTLCCGNFGDARGYGFAAGVAEISIISMPVTTPASRIIVTVA